jgi:hypothetical protein
MKKSLLMFAATSLFVILTVSACGGGQAQGAVPLPQQEVVQQPAFAPVCQGAAPSSCAQLEVSDTEGSTRNVSRSIRTRTSSSHPAHGQSPDFRAS